MILVWSFVPLAAKTMRGFESTRWKASLATAMASACGGIVKLSFIDAAMSIDKHHAE
jgi:hypothetical protein